MILIQIGILQFCTASKRWAKPATLHIFDQKAFHNPKITSVENPTETAGNTMSYQVVPLSDFLVNNRWNYRNIDLEKMPPPPKKILSIFSNYFGHDVKKSVDNSKEISEAKLQALFINRLARGYSWSRNRQFFPGKSGSGLEILLHKKGNSCCAVIEVERPDVKLEKFDDFERISIYVVGIVRMHPQLSLLKIVITNGWTFMFGNLYRRHLQDFKISYIDEVFTLYDWYTILISNIFSRNNTFVGILEN